MKKINIIWPPVIVSSIFREGHLKKLFESVANAADSDQTALIWLYAVGLNYLCNS